jgi:hypothetical protein
MHIGPPSSHSLPTANIYPAFHVLRLRVDIPSLNGKHSTFRRTDRSLRASASIWCSRTHSRSAESAERSHCAAWWDGYLDVLGATWDKLLWQAVDVDALGRVVVGGRDDLDDFVAREL